jgi:hypothetical protein
MIKKLFLLFIGMFLFMPNYAQKGGSNLYGFLNNFNQNATIASLGMDFVCVWTDDINLVLSNPSLLSERVNNDFSLTYTDIFAGIAQYSLAYSHTFKTFGSFAFGVQYLNYGKFSYTEANGDYHYNDNGTTQTFYVSDYAFHIAWGKQLDENVFIGATVKPVISQYESYSAFALAFDVAASYIGTNRLWGLTFMLRNFGSQLKSFNTEKETMPFDVAINVSKKLKHAPLTLYASFTDINRWNLRMEDPLNVSQQTDIEGNIINEESAFLNELDNAFRHLLVGIKLSPFKYFDISLGYSWKRNREMSVGDAFSLTGLSYGINVYIKQFTLSYARSEYHKYGSPNYISLSVKL